MKFTFIPIMKENSDFVSELERLAYEPEEVWLEKLYKFTGFQPVKDYLTDETPKTSLLTIVSNSTKTYDSEQN